MNKKGITKLFGVSLAFMIVTVIAFFAVVFVQEIGHDNILIPLANISNQSAGTLGLSSTMQDYIQEQPDNFNAVIVPYDLYFLLSFLATFISSVIVSYKSREESFMSFFGLITIGMMIFLFVLGFMQTVQDWIITNLIEGFLEFDLITTPIINWYFDNVEIINFAWAAILIIINKINFSFRRETDNFDDVVAEDLGGFER